jgi:hypothetical protein
MYNSRVDGWKVHFRWSRSGTRILVRTATGRATIDALRLNRSVLVKARRVWVKLGLHPPS